MDALSLIFLSLFYFSLLIIPAFLIFSLVKNPTPFSSRSLPATIPKVYPIVGSLPAVYSNWHRRIQWTSDLILISPAATFILHRWFGKRQVFTGNPAAVKHILKTHFHVYQKGDTFRTALRDFIGDGIFSADGEAWKVQRQVSSHEFNTKSLKKFIETVVEKELAGRLIPILKAAARENSVLDFQDVLQRFAFDNICQIAFGYDPACLLPSFPNAKFAEAFEDVTRICSNRFNSLIPSVWKLKKLFNIGSEKRLRTAVDEVRGYAKTVIKEREKELKEKTCLDSVDLLSRFLSSGHFDDNLITDLVMSFILAGRDTTSGTLTWFFWLLSKYPEEENKILKEINTNSEAFSVYEEVKEMDYIHGAICESMRLYPAVPIDSKEAAADDVLPDGTAVKKGTRVAYHPYAMGRLESIWGADWPEFRPERWLERDEAAAGIVGKWRFVGRDNYTYPVFQAGPRICMGKDMAFLQMKRLVAEIVRHFRVVPVASAGDEPEFVQHMTAKMKGGFSVRIEEREETE